MSTSEILVSSQNQDLEMANNNIDLITFASFKDRKERKELKLDIDEKLERQSQCCIYRVPKYLRKMNEEAYTPRVISIGPLHHFNRELSDMEKHKIIFVKEFGNRIKVDFGSRIEEETWQKFINFIGEEEENIRNSYAEMPKQKFKKMEFIDMILYDAVFIIEYLLKSWFPGPPVDISMSNLRQVIVSLETDLLLLENQLPYFVLEELYKLAFSEHKGVHPSFFDLASGLVFDDMFSRMSQEVESTKSSKEREDVQLLSDLKFFHFTDMRRCAMIYNVKKMHHANREIYLPCAVKLQESGVKFKPLEGSELLLDITVQKKKLLWIPPELGIPKIEIYDDTECLFRNLMALEQCHYPDQHYICSYINLMDNLINTVADVNLLVEAGIIYNCVGDNARIAEMFNKLCLHITLGDSVYYEHKKYLKEYTEHWWNNAKATLRRVYFSNLWRGTGTVAAILLLVLTLIQTICSIKSVV